ncbi:TadE family type IV pilus minor pilin [Tersicoccus sp. Bi-70]|uniref:TadE family type IV pilus minor pilin n=1 Tax=Tersicoccus sp. Bi-70 TaxID=1897634 RepID=UPI000978CB62|nr:TadE family type IV pilus minor pilin [Tersicoccus sp. Bi-70]OMH34433.1 hypothetical protein BGP79_04870 [Tersicoccus sp. Bi-70]
MNAPPSRQRGAVTAELAVTLPAVVLLLALLVTGAVAGMTQVRVEGAARAAVRALARGDAAPTATALALAQAGAGARVSIIGAGAQVRVRVEQRVPVLGGVVLPLSVAAEATASREAAGARPAGPDGPGPDGRARRGSVAATVGSAATVHQRPDR